MDDFQPPPTDGWASIIILIVLLLFSMFFSASETAFLSVDKLRIRYLKQKHNKKAVRVDGILRNKQKLLTTSLISNTLVNSLISVLITSVAVSFFGNAAVGIAVPIATGLVLVFGEIIPKTVALVYSESITLNSSFITTTLMKLFSPLVIVFSFLTKPFLTLFGIKQDQKDLNVTEDDLKTFFSESEKAGHIKPHEGEMMEKILDYSEISAKAIMTPRTKIVAAHIDFDLDRVLELSKESRLSRFPVYDKDIDDIKGIFYIKDFLFSDEFMQKFDASLSKAVAQGDKSFELRDYLREPIFVFEGVNSKLLQKYFHENSQNMLIAIDEYGGTAGVVTVEDLTEEIFGNIEDEYDCVDSEPTHIQILDDCLLIPGMLSIAEVNQELGTTFSSEHYETIAGMVLEIIDDMPEVGTKISSEEYEFTVMEIENNQITKLKAVQMGEE
ncbi:MAG: hypothetical protein CR988_05250 [Treponema sp.]|nr:MAG: hypothetical protein CR988_05250 [Treponema sp.]